ncbi:NapC/NirT family cytochrome c, partial [Escherichia coli]|uniref:NapC/NirT family cytochrome c n=1 Tax=Escherichia coli TaxID=562 RepID=UPI00097F8648
GQKGVHETAGEGCDLAGRSMSESVEECQGAVGVSNQEGIRAECAECEIPKSGMDYLCAKLKASEDIYHGFVGGRRGSDDKFEG